MVKLCRQHAELDVETAKYWKEESEVWVKLLQISRRLKILEARRNPNMDQ
jgi:hypothetical protein